MLLRSQSLSRLGVKGAAQESATMNASNGSESQQILGLESALELKTRDLEAANQMCEELSSKLTAAENQFAALQSRNSANEHSVVLLQERLDRLLESQEKADGEIPEAEVYDPEAQAEVFFF